MLPLLFINIIIDIKWVINCRTKVSTINTSPSKYIPQTKKSATHYNRPYPNLINPTNKTSKNKTHPQLIQSQNNKAHSNNYMAIH
jgi:hypothetical protein